MLTALTLAAHLTAAVPLPKEEVVSSTSWVKPPSRRGRAARLLLQGSAGFAAGMALGLVGWASGLADLVPYDELYPNKPDTKLEGLRGGFALGAGLGVFGAGMAVSGDGSLIGMGLGMGVGATTAALIAWLAPEMGGVASLTLPLTGALLGYELGGADSNFLGVRPTFSVWNGRFNLGVTGSF